MTRRYQTRTRSCTAIILATLLLAVVLVEVGISLRPRPTPPAPTPTASPTAFAGRMAVAALPTNTPYLALTPLPSFTPTATTTPTRTPTPTRTATPIPTYVAQINTALANLRGGPGVVYPTVAILGEGEEVTLKGQSEAGDWIVVESVNGNLGWMAASLLSETPGGEALAVLTPPPSPTPAPATATPTPGPPTPSPRPPIALAAAAPGAARVPRLVLANYFVWYDANRWGDCNISAGDRPLQPYSSDDPETIARQVNMAIGAGIDGFTSQWIAPGERTDRNFATLLNRSQGTGFQSTVVFQRHFWAGTGPTQANTAEAIRYILDQYGGHPNFLKINGRPVIFFTDVGRVPRSGSAQEAWAAIRSQADPGRNSWWIAEGLDPSYLSVFDGMWLYNVTHASSPNDYVKAPRWAQNVRSWEQRTGQPKLWVATLMPGSDDSRASCKQDVRAPAPPRVRAREDGNFYRATYNAAAGSNPDLLWVNSFNEWVEGTYIEPSQFYGDAYINLTRELAAQFKGQ